MKRSARIPVRSLLVTALLVAACTFQAVRPEVSVVPAQRYTTFVVADIQAKDKLWDPLVPHFKRGVVERLTEEKAFETVTETPPAAAPAASTVALTGTITEVEKGSAALRWIVGMGAGQAKVKGVFEIKDAAGATLVRFEARESYLGGVGMGGAGFLDMEELMKRLGSTVGKTARRWSRGEPID
jgi:hypothetical protein